MDLGVPTHGQRTNSLSPTLHCPVIPEVRKEGKVGKKWSRWVQGSRAHNPDSETPDRGTVALPFWGLGIDSFGSPRRTGEGGEKDGAGYGVERRTRSTDKAKSQTKIVNVHRRGGSGDRGRLGSWGPGEGHCH